MDNEVSQGLVAEFQRDRLTRLDLCCLRRIIQQIAGLGNGFLSHQSGAGGNVFNQDTACTVRSEVAVSVAYDCAGTVCHKELHI